MNGSISNFGTLSQIQKTDANAKPKTTLVSKNYINPRHESRSIMTKTQEENFIEIPKDIKNKEEFIK